MKADVRIALPLTRKLVSCLSDWTTEWSRCTQSTNSSTTGGSKRNCWPEGIDGIPSKTSYSHDDDDDDENDDYDDDNDVYDHENDVMIMMMIMRVMTTIQKRGKGGGGNSRRRAEEEANEGGRSML